MTVPTATVSFIVCLTLTGGSTVLVGPFTDEEAANAWLADMPSSEATVSERVLCVCAPVRDDGQPNY